MFFIKKSEYNSNTINFNNLLINLYNFEKLCLHVISTIFLLSSLCLVRYLFDLKSKQVINKMESVTYFSVADDRLVLLVYIRLCCSAV